MASCLIGIGSNLGDRAATVRQAVDSLGSSPAEVRVVAVSRLHETDSIGGPADQPTFLNAALLVESSLSPPGLLRRLMSVEIGLGRKRDEHWGPRTVDLDLLLYDDLVMQTSELTLPHPRMAVRRFVLEPAVEVAPQMVHPTTGWTIAKLLDHLEHAKPYVAISGAIGVGKTALARRIVEKFGGRIVLEPLREASLTEYYAHPTARAWELETTLLSERASLLAKLQMALPLAVSDFWIEQSLAFASLFMSAGDQSRFAEFHAASVAEVERPKLLIVLDAPAGVLVDRIRQRNRPYEKVLDIGWLDRLREAIARLAAGPGIGPTLWLSATDVAAVHREVFAALEAMGLTAH